MHDEERMKPLSHDGGQLLQMLIRRLSIRREDWVHDYCFIGIKGQLKKKKKERQLQLADDMRRLDVKIHANDPCVVVGMGKLSCEVLTGASLVSAKAGTCWNTEKYGKVWVTYSPDAAMFDPTVVVDIYGVLANAAKAAGIETQLDLSVPMFNWDGFHRKRDWSRGPAHQSYVKS